jgi:cytochrome P450
VCNIRGIVFADYGKKWKNARTAVLSILAPKVVDTFAGAMEKEAARTIDVLIEETIKKGAIDPVDSIRCCSMNNILLLAFGTRVESSEDPLFKELVHMAVSGGKFAGPVFDFSAYFPILSFLDIIFRKEHTMREFVKTVTLPIFARLVKIARENDHDSLVKQLDKEREALDIDERNLLVIMGNYIIVF